MEAFSRKQMKAQMGMYLVMGIVQAFVFVGLLQGANYFMMSGGLFSRIGREKANLAQVNIKWDDVIGMESVKKEAWELVKLLKDRNLVKSIGGKIIKGTMMIGTSGMRKNLSCKSYCNRVWSSHDICFRKRFCWNVRRSRCCADESCF